MLREIIKTLVHAAQLVLEYKHTLLQRTVACTHSLHVSYRAHIDSLSAAASPIGGNPVRAVGLQPAKGC